MSSETPRSSGGHLRQPVRRSAAKAPFYASSPRSAADGSAPSSHRVSTQSPDNPGADCPWSPCIVGAYAHVPKNDVGAWMRMPKSGEAKMKMDERLATSVSKAFRRVTQLFDNTLAPCGLRFTQYSTLAQLATRSEVPTGTKLAEATVSHRSSHGYAFLPLVWDGYVVLRRGETDRRTQRSR